MLKFLISALAIGSNITSYFHQYNYGKYNGGENVTIDYVENYPVFTTSYNPNYIITTLDGQENCELYCNNVTTCLGYTYLLGSGECNLLNNLGNNSYMVSDDISFRKSVYYSSNNTSIIKGISYFTQRSHENTTYYLDYNHNGILDEGEPSTQAQTNREFQFENLTQGMYLLRQVTPKDCFELYPGVYGYTSSFEGEGFFDYVRYYYPYNNITGSSPNSTLSYITGKNNNTYLSFYENYTITLGMIDDMIINGEGSDIFFNVIGNSTVFGNVSVSKEGKYFTNIGTLSSNHTDFDINSTSPIKFVKIDFFGNNTEPLKIANIRSRGRVYYSPPFSYYVSTDNIYNIFVTDCSYYYSCETFCDYHVDPYNYRSSCKIGCKTFEDTNRCSCSYSDHSNYLYSDFNETECEIGCMYRMNKEFFPVYKAFDNSMGLEETSIQTYDNLNESISHCEENDFCRAVSFGNQDFYTSHDSFQRIFRDGSYFLVKRQFLNETELDYITSTPTTTLTTTATTTLTTTATTTLTTTATTTLTTTIDLIRNHTISDTEIAVIVVIVCLAVILPISIYKCNKDKSLSKRKVNPNVYSSSFTNPVYNLEKSSTEDFTPHYMDVFEETDTNL